MNTNIMRATPQELNIIASRIRQGIEQERSWAWSEGDADAFEYYDRMLAQFHAAREESHDALVCFCSR